MSYPQIKTYDTKEYKLKQSQYASVDKLPTRTILLAPSNSGKTVLLANFILDIYKACFEQVYIFSPSINRDDNWQAVKQYLDKRNKTQDKLYFDEYNHDDLMKIIDTQESLINFQKKNKHKKLFQIAIIIDDFADDPRFVRSSKLLHALFTRGRHKCISTFVSSQKFSALAPIIRVNASSYKVFRLRNYNDLEMFLIELGAIFKNKNKLYQVYKEATEEAYNFLYVKLTAKTVDDIFHLRFERLMEIPPDDY